jgi:hypothetical protein
MWHYMATTMSYTKQCGKLSRFCSKIIKIGVKQTTKKQNILKYITFSLYTKNIFLSIFVFFMNYSLLYKLHIDFFVEF